LGIQFWGHRSQACPSGGGMSWTQRFLTCEADAVPASIGERSTTWTDAGSISAVLALNGDQFLFSGLSRLGRVRNLL
jgi:hypothetical protein